MYVFRPVLNRAIPLLAVALILGCSSTDNSLRPEIETGTTGLGGTIGPRSMSPNGLPRVPRQLIARVGDGHTIEEVNTSFATTTVRHIPGTSFYLVETPEGASEDDIADSMLGSLLCDVAESNCLLQPPETERYSAAFYEGTFSHDDYVDQEALGRIGTAAAHLLSTGSGVRVAVIDTGIDLDHPDLVDNIGPGYDLLDGDAQPDDLPNGIDEDGDGVADEAAGHGTHVAGIIAAVAPDVTILPYRVLDSEGIGCVFDVAEGIQMAIANGADIINLSLGLDDRPDVMRRAIDEAEDQGVLVIASAGNRGIEDRYHFPASENSKVMAVTAVDANDIKAYFASFGSHVDVSAPGVGIMSTYWNGGYAIWSGTSMAAPFTSGAAALGLAIDPGLGHEIQDLIENTALELDDSPHMWYDKIGEGRLRVDELVCQMTPGCAPLRHAAPRRVSHR